MSNTMHFRIFSDTPEELLLVPYVAPALQTIETSFLLISHGRWQSVIALLGGSCELLLKGKYPDIGKFHKLIDVHAKYNNLSNEFRRQAHELRKLRNEVMHNGLTPKDDHKCIEAFFTAMPYMDKILQTEYKIKLWDLVPKYGSTGDRNWIADTYAKTRKVVTEK